MDETSDAPARRAEGVPAGGAVDLSNVCWSARIPPLGAGIPRLARLDAVQDAWRRRFGPGAPLTVIADRSLRHQIGRAERPRFDALLGSGAMTLAPTADPELLRLARDRQWYVVSGDQFLDLRRDHPWIAGAADRFLGWDLRGGRLVLRPSGIREVPEQQISRAVEAKSLKWPHRIDVRDPAHLRVLRSHWRCSGPRCLRALLWPDHLLDWPTLTAQGAVLCPACNSALTEAGPRGAVRSLVVSDAASGTELVRFPLCQDTPVLLGRGRLAHGINLEAPELRQSPAIGRVSRRHLMLNLTAAPGGPRITAVDLGSGNGTVVERGEPGAVPRALEPGGEVVLGDRDALRLGDAVTVRVSGRRWFADEDLALPVLAQTDGAQPTRLVT